MGKRRFQVPLLFSLVLFGIGIASARFFAAKDTFSPIAAILAESPFTVKEYVIQAGDAWGTLAPELGINANLAALLLEASETEGSHPLTEIRAGNKLSIYADKATGEFDHLVYDINDEEILTVASGTTAVTAAKEKIQYEITPTVKRGTIESSLFESALASGIPEEIVLDLAWIFSWDIDFTTAIRTGDAFAVLYEERKRDGAPVRPGRVLAASFKNDGQDYYAIYYVDPTGEGQYYGRGGEEKKRQFLRAPLDYRRISSGFSTKRYVEILEYFGSHRAIDYAAAPGTPVSATSDGTVTYVGWKGDHGNHVAIRHGNGYATGYSHLSSFARGVAVGAKVKQNQVIGYVGDTGLTTGPHLHYEMRLNGTLINPLTLDLPSGKPIKEEYRADFEAKAEELLSVLNS